MDMNHVWPRLIDEAVHMAVSQGIEGCPERESCPHPVDEKAILEAG
jgi:hypothetical protein